MTNDKTQSMGWESIGGICGVHGMIPKQCMIHADENIGIVVYTSLSTTREELRHDIVSRYLFVSRFDSQQAN